jgi:DNA-binding NarL/FixJ family response regulator
MHLVDAPTIASVPRTPAAVPVSVVLADAHDVYRRGIARSLERAGCRVLAEVGDGVEALDACVTLRPDVLIVSSRLPTLDGVDVVRALARHPRGTDPCTVVLTADFDPCVERRALDAGATAVVDKTAPRSEIRTRVARALALHQDRPARPFPTARRRVRPRRLGLVRPGAAARPAG